MIIDAMDLLYTQRFDAFALISSDSDFTSLATRLRESEIHVIGFGKSMTPTAFKNACDDYVAIENLSSITLGESQPDEEHRQQLIVKDGGRELWRSMHQSWQNYRDESGWAKLGEPKRESHLELKSLNVINLKGLGMKKRPRYAWSIAWLLLDFNIFNSGL